MVVQRYIEPEKFPHNVDLSKIEKELLGFRKGRLITFGECFGNLESEDPCQTMQGFYEMIVDEIGGEDLHIQSLSPKEKVGYWFGRFGSDYIRMCESAKKLIEENYSVSKRLASN